MVRFLEAAEQALQETTDTVVDIGPGLTLCEPVEEVPVGVAVGLLQAYVLPLLPVSPVLLAQPGLLAYTYPPRVEPEDAQRLVCTAVGETYTLTRSSPKSSRNRSPVSSACFLPRSVRARA
ncbi:hypothetical protein SHKM778_23110 [Streptomyces sp. KM77-8]|uniref:Uncharacterized protein n=1 Tax=Streptomyces haneummycinicus TaxID=3074435 RepID=A0AAT9HF52_9ACTN